MATLRRLRKRTDKYQAHVDRPAVITGNFEMHYEDVVQRNRFIIIAFVLTGLLAVAAFIPAAVYQSTADSQRIIVEAENGKITNPAHVTIVKGDTAAGGDGYIEFGN
ncbi:MAG: hypothetical protein JWO47_368 [Candidatus Saccharibacteria bacterium]|nr:hypothetical protein [Candidatus Saccharibacteria bacterium]